MIFFICKWEEFESSYHLLPTFSIASPSWGEPSVSRQEMPTSSYCLFDRIMFIAKTLLVLFHVFLFVFICFSFFFSSLRMFIFINYNICSNKWNYVEKMFSVNWIDFYIYHSLFDLVIDCNSTGSRCTKNGR